jgi:hypothetical protein
MIRRLGTKSASLIGTISLILALLLSSLSVTVDAQTSDGSYKLFGVNLVGTLPMMNKSGQSTTSGDLQTLDSRMYLKIPMGTIIHNAAGKNQEFISATLIPNPTSLPAQQKSILAYELGTPGATFNPTVGLSFNYSDAELPASVSEASLYIAQWNGSAWVKLTSDVNTSFNTVSTTISSFTSYALLGGASSPTTTTTLPPSTIPTTSLNPTTTTSIQTSTTATSNPDSSSTSPIIFIVAGGGVLLVIMLVLVTRKK